MSYLITLVVLVLLGLPKYSEQGGATLFYFNRNTGVVEYNSGDNNGGNHYPSALYIKRYYITCYLRCQTEVLEHQTKLLPRSHLFGHTMIRNTCAGETEIIVCISKESMEGKAIYRTVLFHCLFHYLSLLLKAQQVLTVKEASVGIGPILNLFTV